MNKQGVQVLQDSQVLSDAQLNRLQQQREELSGAVLRALTGHRNLYFRSHQLHRDNTRIPIHAPHLQAEPEQDDLDIMRGISDGMALRVLHTDEALHRSLCPGSDVERLMFEILEQLRVESLVAHTLPGMVRNVRQRFEQWADEFHHAGLTHSSLGILLYTLAMICWARLNNYPLPEHSEDLMESTRAGISPLIGKDLQALKLNRENQAVYAQHALDIARKLHQMMQDQQELHQKLNSKSTPDKEDEDSKKVAQHLRLLVNFNETEADGFAIVSSGESKAFSDSGGQYRIFSTEFDRTLPAQSLARAAELRTLRIQLDEHIARQGINMTRLTRQLRQMFSLPRWDGWDLGKEEGYIDGRRLTQLVTNPAERRLFKREATPPRSDALLTFLLDCSGSMKVHAQPIATLLDIFGRALEQAGIQSEILGFTTGAWNGGRVAQAWQQQGSPQHPGRLNEVRQIIYKDMDTSWRRARPSIAALLKADLYREGVDGEAVDWACERLLQRDTRRRLLMVISDGCPMDGATQQANDPFYLDNHLRQVVERHEKQGMVEIYGLGVGLDLSPYYRHNLPIDLEAGVNYQLFADILALFRH